MNQFEVNNNTVEILRKEVEIPEKVQQRIDQTLAGLDEGRAKSGIKRKRTFSKIAMAAAACLMAIPTVAFAAYISGENSAFYQAIFGNTSRPSIEEKVEYDEDGKIKTNLPNMERVDVDEAQAERLVGQYVKTLGTEYKLEAYDGTTTTLTLHSALYDSETGIFQAYMSLEQAGGVSGLEVFNDGECYFGNNDLLLYGDMAPGKLYYDAANSTMDKAYITVVGVYTGGDSKNMVFGEFIPKDELRPEDAANSPQDGLSRDLATIDFEALASSLPSIKAGEAININSLGMRLDLAGLGFENAADDYGIKYLSVKFADGSEYVLRDREKNMESMDYGLTVTPEGSAGTVDRAYTTYCFNRLVDVDKVVSVDVNGQQYSIR